MKSNKKAFTLIELLVVVLIIGILAAVAVPQYQKAVEKSRLAELMQNIRTLKQIASMYVLENGVPSSSITLKDIPTSMELTGGEWIDQGYYYATNYFKYGCDIVGPGGDIEPGKLYCEIWRNNNNSSGDPLYAIAIMQDASSLCFTYASSLGNYICQTLHEWDNSIDVVEGEL